MSTPDPALLDTDVASVLYRARLFQRVVPAGLVGVVHEGSVPAGHAKAEQVSRRTPLTILRERQRLTDVAASMVSIRMAYGGRGGRRPPTAATPDDGKATQRW